MVIEISGHDKNGVANRALERRFFAEYTLANGASVNNPVSFKMADTVFMLF